MIKRPRWKGKISGMKGERSVPNRWAKGVRYGMVKISFANRIIKTMNPMIEIAAMAQRAILVRVSCSFWFLEEAMMGSFDLSNFWVGLAHIKERERPGTLIKKRSVVSRASKSVLGESLS